MYLCVKSLFISSTNLYMYIDGNKYHVHIARVIRTIENTVDNLTIISRCVIKILKFREFRALMMAFARGVSHDCARMSRYV